MSTNRHQRTGQRGEDVATAHLRGLGWAVLGRNQRIPGIRGEIDIVADDGRDVVIAEVKTIVDGSPFGPASPLEQVGPRKRRQLRALAGAWCEENRERMPSGRGLRIDVIGVRFDASGTVTIGLEHIEAAC